MHKTSVVEQDSMPFWNNNVAFMTCTKHVFFPFCSSIVEGLCFFQMYYRFLSFRWWVQLCLDDIMYDRYPCDGRNRCSWSCWVMVEHSSPSLISLCFKLFVVDLSTLVLSTYKSELILENYCILEHEKSCNLVTRW